MKFYSIHMARTCRSKQQNDIVEHFDEKNIAGIKKKYDAYCPSHKQNMNVNNNLKSMPLKKNKSTPMKVNLTDISKNA